MCDETNGSVTTPDPNAGRYRHLFRAVLLAIGLSYVFAVPFVAEDIIYEVEYDSDELCLNSWDPGIGIEIEDEPPGGKIRCKLLLRRVLIIWSIYALIFLPVVSPLAALRYVMRRAADAEGPSSGLQRRDKIVRIVGVGILFVYVVGGTFKQYVDWYW